MLSVKLYLSYMTHTYTRFILITMICCHCLLWQSCKVKNNEGHTPTYIHIDSFQFKTNPKWPQLTTSRITTVAVYYNNNPVGTFDLPATIPVLASGTGTLMLTPGIAVSGQNEQSAIYPFYQPDTMTVNAQPGKVITVLPSTTYYNKVKTHLISDFSGSSGFALYAGNKSIVSDNGVGVIQLSAVGDSSVDSTMLSFSIPDGVSFIEFDYKSDVPFSVGMQSNLDNSIFAKEPIATIYPSSDWKKFYLNINAFVSQYKSDNYHFYIKANLGAGQTSGKLLIDNIYLLTL